MKKLELKNLKVVKLTTEEKKNVSGGKIDWRTSSQCNTISGPWVS